MKSCSLAWLALHHDRAVVRLKDAMHHGQSEARSFAGTFGREKRFKNAGQRGRIHALAVVLNGQALVWSGMQGRMQGPGRLIQRDRPLRDADQPVALFHGVPRVGAKIDDDLMDLRRIAQDGAGAGRDVGDDLHFLGQGGADQFHRVGHDGMEKHQFALIFLLAGEGEDLLRDFLGALAGLEHLLQVPADAVALAHFHFGQVTVTHDDAQDIVEFMRRAAGQSAQGFHL